MLLKNCNHYSKKFFTEFFEKKTSFFVINIIDFDNIFSLTDFFKSLKIFHHKIFLNFFIDDYIFDFFAGNNYFIFLNLNEFYYYLLKTFSEVQFELLGVCFDNFFLNLNNRFFNTSNVLFYNFYLYLFYYFIFLNLFLFKLMNIVKKKLKLLSGKC